MSPCRPLCAGALAGLVLAGLACGRIGLDQPVGANDGIGGNDGQGGGIQVGGQTGRGGGSGGSAAGGAPGSGGSAGNIPCHQITDELTCLRRETACRTDYCSGFVRCANPDDPRLPCAVPPGQLSCAAFKFPVACQSVPWCHPIYSALPPSEVCAAPNVCAMLVACGDNGTAQCAGAIGTRCGGDPPSCAPGYTASLNSAGCYEGCTPLFYCG